MSNKLMSRGGAQKWTSVRATTAAAQPITTPSQPHPAGGHGFEDSAVNEHARKMHQAAPTTDEAITTTMFDRQLSSDALSNLSCFREDIEKMTFGAEVVPRSNINFAHDVMLKIKLK